jgi:predicted Zn finger-like uncharacterized protein
MNVVCPGCQNSYKLDERRIPEKGQRMRCPKCSCSFKVNRDGTTTENTGSSSTPDSRSSVLPKRPDRSKEVSKPEAENSISSSLPAVLGGHSDLPAPKATNDFFGDIDLPAPAGVDLPAPKATDDFFGDIDLPTPAGVDLPAPKATDDFFGDIDTSGQIGGPHGDIPAPDPMDPFGEIDLPTPSGAVDLPSPARGVSDLPSPARGVSDLPSPANGVTDLPSPANGVTDLPSPSEAITDLPEPTEGITGLPSPIPAPPMSDGLDSPSPNVERVASSGSTDFGQIDLGEEPAVAGSQPDIGEEFDAFGASARTSNAVSDTIDLAQSPREHITRGSVIDEAPEVTADPSQKKKGMKFEGRRRYERQSRRGKIALLVIVVLLGVGGAGLYFTPLGPFGINVITKMLPSAASGQIVEQLADKIDKRLRDDTITDLDKALDDLQIARKELPDNEDLKLISTFVHNTHQIRFGVDKKLRQAATKALGKIDLDKSDSPYAALAITSMDLIALKIPKVIQSCKKKRSLDSNMLALLAEAHLYVGDFAQALEQANLLLKKEASARAGYLVTRSLIGLGRIADAKTNLMKQMKSHRKHTDSKLSFANVLIEEKDRDTAAITNLLTGVHELSHNAVTDIQRARAHSLLGRLHLIDREYARAVGEFDLAEALNPKDVVLLVGRGLLALQRDDLPGASSYFTRARSEDPSDLRARLGQADAMIRQGLLADAKTLLIELLPNHPNNSVVHYLMGRVEMALKNNAKSEKEFGMAIALDKTFIEPYVGLSELLMKTGRDTEAMRTLDEASRVVPDSALVKLTLAEGYAGRGDFPTAIVSLNEALNLEPDNVRAHFRMAQMYRKMGANEDARAALDEVAARSKNYPGLALELGLLMEISGNVAKALASYEKALAANPDDVGAKIRVAAASHLSGNTDRARKMIEEALAADPKSAEANFYMGEILRSQDNAAEASLFLKTAMELEEQNPLYHLRYGMALIELRDMPSAFKELDRAMTLDPEMPEIYLRIGEAKLRSGSARDSIRILDKALNLDPKLAEAYGLIGEALEELADLNSAMSYYQRAISEIPDDARMHFKLALAQLRIGSNRTATKHLLTAIKLNENVENQPPWLPEALYRLGIAQLSTGQRAAAITSFKKYLEIAPAGAIDRVEVVAQLEQLEN